MRLCPADSVSVCALIGAHLLVEERTSISCSPHVVHDTVCRAFNWGGWRLGRQ